MAVAAAAPGASAAVDVAAAPAVGKEAAVEMATQAAAADVAERTVETSEVLVAKGAATDAGARSGGSVARA